MNLISSQNKILFKLIFLQTSLIYSELPVSKNINNVTFLPEQQVLTEIQTIATKTLQQRHSQLRKQITSTEKNDKRNYFACCFVFKLSTGQEIEIPILDEFITQIPISETQPLKSKLATLDKNEVLKVINDIKIYNQHTTNITFVSHSPKERVNIKMTILHKLFLGSVKQDNAATKNQAMILKTIDERSVGPDGNVKYDILSAMRSTDSEAGAIYILQQEYILDNIINRVMSLLTDSTISNSDTKPTVTSIEFHGCTTRDMCALCFTNMNIIQYLSNKDEDFGFSFLRYLKYKVREKNSQALCPTKIFISSFKAGNGNLNFNSRNLAPNYNDDCVYQFRIEPLCQ